MMKVLIMKKKVTYTRFWKKNYVVDVGLVHGGSINSILVIEHALIGGY